MTKDHSKEITVFANGLVFSGTEQPFDFVTWLLFSSIFGEIQVFFCFLLVSDRLFDANKVEGRLPEKSL